MMESIDASPENIQLAVDMIRNHYYETSSTINPLQEALGETPNPLKGKCYICSAVLQNIFGKQNIKLQRCRDRAIPTNKNYPETYHWWCITNDGEKIDITQEQYKIENRNVPGLSDSDVIENMTQLPYATLKDKVIALTEIIQNKLKESL